MEGEVRGSLTHLKLYRHRQGKGSEHDGAEAQSRLRLAGSLTVQPVVTSRSRPRQRHVRDSVAGDPDAGASDCGDPDAGASASGDSTVPPWFSGSRLSSSKGLDPFSAARAWSRSSSFVHRPMSRVATALPVKFVSARASDKNLSMPTMTPMPSSGSGRCAWRPAASVASPAPVTPAAPFEAMIMKTRSEICRPRSIGMPIALETKSAAIVR